METLDMDVPGLSGTHLQAHRLHRILGNALLCVSEDEEIPQLGVVYLTVDAEANRLTAASTDRYTLLIEHAEARTTIGCWEAGIPSEGARLIRQTITSAEKEAYAKDELSVLIRPDAGALRVDVGNMRLDVPIVDFKAPGFGKLLSQALDHDPQPMPLTINPTFFARVSKVIGPGDDKKHRDPVAMTYCGERRPIRFAWGPSLHLLAMPYVGWDSDTGASSSAEVSSSERSGE